MTVKQTNLIRSGIRILVPVLIWGLFSKVGFHLFLTNHDLSYLLLLALSFSGILSQVTAKNKQPVILIGWDSVFLILGIKLFFSSSAFNGWLLLLDFILANLLSLTRLINEPHCQWIIYGVISGSGMTFLFNITAHHYFSLISLMSITLLIFANIFFSFSIFIKVGNRLSLVVIMGLILAICATLMLGALKILIIILILGFYLFFEWRVNVNKYDTRSDTSLICLLLFSLVACL